MQINWKWKVGIAAIILLIISALVFIIIRQQDIANQQKLIEQNTVEMKRLNDELVRAQANYASKKDIETIIKQSGIDVGSLKKDLERLNAEVQSVTILISRTPGYSGSSISSTSTTPRPPTSTTTTTITCPEGTQVECPNPDIYGYLRNQQWLALNEPFDGTKKVPYGRVGFSAWEKAPWSVQVYPREYQATTVISTNEDGRHFAHSRFVIKSNGETVAVPIEAKIVEEVPAKHMSWWNPRLYLGADAGARFNPLAFEFVPNLQLALMSYGNTKVSPDFYFLGIGAGYETQENNVAFIFSPIAYNIGKDLPLVDNMFVGPSLAIDTDSNFSILLGIHVGL
jgi:hypothetical protein